MSLARQPSIDQLQWLLKEAPQFHEPQPEPEPQPTYAPAAHHADSDSDSDEPSDGGSDSSDSEDEDPYHPNNVADNTRWVKRGDYVYALEDLQETYHNHPANRDDSPYVPPMAPAQDKGKQRMEIASHDLAPSSPFAEPYTFKESPPSDVQAISPLDLTRPLPSPTSTARPQSRRRVLPARATRTTYVDIDADGDVDMLSDDEDEDAFESSGDDASEDEYVPSPQLRPRKLRSSSLSHRSHGHGHGHGHGHVGSSTASRTKKRAAARHARSPYSSASSPGAYASSTTGSTHASSGNNRPGSRNRQFTNMPPPPKNSWAKTGPEAYHCPYCDHVQKNRRAPDMERHILSHFREYKRPESTEDVGVGCWVCCGVPPEDAARYGADPEANPWMFRGRLLVGGCHGSFSRQDALKRHWKNRNNRCVGDVYYSRPERVRDE